MAATEDELKRQLTELRQENVQLKEQLEFTKKFMDNSNYWETYRDKSGKIVYMSPNLEKVLKQRKETYIQGDLKTTDFIHDDDIEKTISNYKKVMQGFDVPPHKCRLKNTSSTQYVLIDYKRVLDSDGQLAGIRTCISDITALEKKEKNLQLILDTIPALVGQIDTELKYAYVNEMYEVYSGIEAQKIIGKNVKDVLGENTFKISQPYMLRALSGENVSFETRYENAEGEELIFLSNFVPNIENKEVKSFFVVAWDITENRKAEEALKESEQRFYRLYNKSHVGTAIVGLDKCFISCNESFCRFLGYSKEEIIGKSIADFTHPEDSETGMDDMKRIVKGEIDFALVQKRYVRKDNIVVWGELTISLIRDEDNNPLYFIPVIQDITEKYQAEKALKESEARFHELIKNSFDMFVLLDSDGIQQFVSESCEKLLGYKPEELIGIPVIEKMIHPEDQEPTIRAFLDMVKNKTNGGAQYRHLHKNGNWVYLEAYGNNQLDNPDINAVILNVRDITERKRAEQLNKENEIKLRELNATKDKLFSIIAHDLRSPFNSIIGLSDLLIGNDNDNYLAQSEKYASLINSSAKNTLVLLDNLLNWAKSQTGQMSFNPAKINLSSLVDEIIENSNSRVFLKNISLNAIQPGDVEVYADENMVMIILRNLISNAIKFTNQGGKINVIVIPGTKYVEVSVSDNGVGMNEEKQSTLFNISLNTTMPGTANEKGTGLGLVLCKEFVDKLGGNIWVESKEGVGSVFKFTLPMYQFSA